MSKFIAYAVACGLAATVLPAVAMADDGDATAGANVFKKCMPCHNADVDKVKVGPPLKGVIGRQPGTYPDFKYSQAMMDFGQGKVWDEALLKTYLPDPKALVKGTKMAFPGLKDPKEIADVIAYLKQYSPPK